MQSSQHQNFVAVASPLEKDSSRFIFKALSGQIQDSFQAHHQRQWMY